MTVSGPRGDSESSCGIRMIMIWYKIVMYFYGTRMIRIWYEIALYFTPKLTTNNNQHFNIFFIYICIWLWWGAQTFCITCSTEKDLLVTLGQGHCPGGVGTLGSNSWQSSQVGRVGSGLQLRQEVTVWLQTSFPSTKTLPVDTMDECSWMLMSMLMLMSWFGFAALARSHRMITNVFPFYQHTFCRYNGWMLMNVYVNVNVNELVRVCSSGKKSPYDYKRLSLLPKHFLSIQWMNVHEC